MTGATNEPSVVTDGGEGWTCATCGSAIEPEQNHRVITWVEDDEVRALHFCDEKCRQDWPGE